MAIDQPRFKKVNEEFSCTNCKAKVGVASATCRDHCPACLWSQHVDNNPGDRASHCGGALKPVGYEWKSGKGYMIVYKCLGCGLKRVNKFLERDAMQPDSIDALLALTQDFVEPP